MQINQYTKAKKSKQEPTSYVIMITTQNISSVTAGKPAILHAPKVHRVPKFISIQKCIANTATLLLHLICSNFNDQLAV